MSFRLFGSIFVCLAMSCAPACAEVSTQQMQTLKALALADPVASQYITSPSFEGDAALADWYNALGACVAWRTSITPAEYREAVTWTAVDGLTAGKARIWDWLTAGMTLPVDSSKSNVRQGIADAWGAGSATGVALTALAKRPGTRAESALATGACTTASPGSLVWEGRISQAVASTIRSLP